MADETRPLLFFPAPAITKRSNYPGRAIGRVYKPSIERQRERLAPQFETLRHAFEAKRLKLQAVAPLQDPELVLVLEIAGSLDDFANAVKRVPELEWLGEMSVENIEPDDDFFELKDDEKEAFDGRLFLIGSNQQALQQLLSMWDRYQANTAQKFSHRLNKFRNLFAQLRVIRPWDASDRIDDDVRAYWRTCLDHQLPAVRFEIEAWYSKSEARNASAAAEIETLVADLGGQVLQRLVLSEILYHGFLVELPAAAIQDILDGVVPELVLSDRIMFFRPKAQSISDGTEQDNALNAPPLEGLSEGPPIVALLDGLPLQNHALLQGRLEVDDPDGWENGYEAKDRVHGTAMASLILLGELDGDRTPIRSKLYVRPIMKPDLSDGFNARRKEQTPDDVLLIDLVHRAVKRICEGEGGEPAVAPTVRVINLSVGDDFRVFAHEMCPWARLLDWLAHRYSILFIISVGNRFAPLQLATQRDQFGQLPLEARAKLAFRAMVGEGSERRLIAPAEAINALTVGAIHDDSSQPPQLAERLDLFSKGGLSPLSRIGHGFRRGIKPDILMPGGRVLHQQQIGGSADVCLIKPASFGTAPGHLVAAPPLPGQGLSQTTYARGTSNAAALASRAAARAHEVMEALRQESEAAPSSAFDAVVLKALLVHGASWRDAPQELLDQRPDFEQIENAQSRRSAEKDFLVRWLGYGFADVARAIACADQRATLIGVGEIGPEQGLVFSVPLPPSLAGKVVWRRLTVTLAWISPVNCGSQAYRRAKLWLMPPQAEVGVRRRNSVHEKAALRGTVQHEILEGDEALAFVDGKRFQCQVNCAPDAGGLAGKVRFALCISLEVEVETGIPIYEEIRARVAVPVPIGVHAAA